MYQSWCDVVSVLIWRDATESTLVKSQTTIPENNNHTLETNDCNLESGFYSIKKNKSEITKERRKGQKNPLSANTEGTQKSVYKGEHSWGHSVLRSQREGHIRK